MKLIKANMAKIEDDFDRKGVADAIFFDDEMKRFGLRLRTSGRRSWIVQYEKWGRSRRVTLGSAAVLTPEQARHLAKQELAKVDLGADIASDRAEAKVKEKRLLKSVIEQYLQAREIDLRKGELRQTSFTEITRYLTKTFTRLHHMPISAIQRADVASVLREKADKPSAAALARSVLSTFFGWAVYEGFVDANPVPVAKKKAKAKPRERVLDDRELAAVWNACQDDDYGKIVCLLILTGARRDEIGGMTWKELDSDNRAWTLPAERSKNGRALKLTLPGLAWEIIERASHRTFNDHLFGIGKNGFNNWYSTKNALHQRSGTAGWTVHDLRRSAATGMADIGIQPHIIEAVLNHVSGHKAGVAGIYNRSSYEREVRNALALWAEHIISITTGEQRKVISFPHERGSEPAA
jgi:integrase